MVHDGKVLKRRTAIILSVIFLILALLFTSVGTDLLSKEETRTADMFIGIDVGYGDENDVYRIADAVKGYANLIIIGSLNVTQDTAALTRVCDYLHQGGFYFIVYVGFAEHDYLPPRGPDSTFFDTASNRWGEKFLGAYFFDEVGGKMLDSLSRLFLNVPNIIIQARDYTYVAEALVSELTGDLAISVGWYNPTHMHPRLFTSDYALYWYDYLSGYDVVFGEIVGNQSGQIAIAMDRGAAHVLGKDWGIMITYSCQNETCVESPTELYDDMMLAWQSGAKYIVVFDGNATVASPYGALMQEHIEAIKKFWNYTKINVRSAKYPADTSYVLPRDYGYGFRSPNDTIWGFWQADNQSAKIWNDTNSLLATYGNSIDIVYETRINDQPITLPYSTLILWNGTIVKK